MLRVMSDAGPNVFISIWEKRLDLTEDRPAEVASETHRASRAEVHRHDRGHAENERHQEHQPAGLDDERGVPLGDALVDDLAVERRQVEVADAR